MKLLEIGKLYTCSASSLLVFPTENIALSMGMSAVGGRMASDWWSKKLNCNVSVVPAGQVFCVLEIGCVHKLDLRQVHLISSEAIKGWFNINDWLLKNIQELSA